MHDKGMCGAEGGETAGGWRKLRNEKNHGLCDNILNGPLLIGVAAQIFETLILVCIASK
jgi:hypothetical protein